MRLHVLAPIAFVACTPTHTATFAFPAPNGADVRVIFHDEMSSSFALDARSVSLDGAPIAEGAFQHVAPGHHAIVVSATYHFVSHCIYCYVRAYKFVVRSRHDIDVGDSNITLHAIAYEKGGVTTPIEERPAVRWVTR